MKFFTHDCQVSLYGLNQTQPCGKQTQTRCSNCSRWCCVLHRQTLSNDLKRPLVYCAECLETREEGHSINEE